MIAHWVEDPEDVWRLTGARDLVVNTDKVVSWTWEANYTFTLRSHGDLVAYGEIVEDEVDNDVEIQHLVVAPDVRGQGIGKAMLSRLCAFLEAGRPYDEVWLRVGRDNEPAARCASAIGFVVDEKMSGPRYAWYKKELTRVISALPVVLDTGIGDDKLVDKPRTEAAKPPPDNSRLQEVIQRELDSLERERKSDKPRGT